MRRLLPSSRVPDAAHRRGQVLALAVLAVVAAGCASTASHVEIGAPASSPAPSSSSTGGGGASEQPGEPTPVVGECHGPVDAAIIDAPTDTRPAVPCGKAHGAETFYVGQMPSSVTQWPGAADDTVLSQAVDEECTSRHQAYLGLTNANADTLPPDRVQDFAYFIPNQADFAAGARWFRCDAVVEPVAAGEKTTIAGTLKDVYAKPLTVGYRLCEGNLNQLAACNERHQVEYLASVQLPDATNYPAQRDDVSVTAACRNPLLGALGLTEERADLAFGYVLPPQDVWEAGFQTATCVAGAADNAALDNSLYHIGPTKPLPLAPR